MIDTQPAIERIERLSTSAEAYKNQCLIHCREARQKQTEFYRIKADPHVDQRLKAFLLKDKKEMAEFAERMAAAEEELAEKDLAACVFLINGIKLLYRMNEIRTPARCSRDYFDAEFAQSEPERRDITDWLFGRGEL